MITDARRSVCAALYHVRQKLLQDLVVNGREVLPDITFQDVRKPGRRLPGSLQRPMRAESLAARERVLRESPLENRLEYLGERMVNDTVAERSRRNHSRLRFPDEKLPVGPRAVFARFQFAPQADQFGLLLQQKCARRPDVSSFPGRRVAPPPEGSRTRAAFSQSPPARFMSLPNSPFASLQPCVRSLRLARRRSRRNPR